MQKKYNIPSLSNSVLVLEVIAANDSGLTLKEINKRVPASKTTIFRILHTLENEKIIEKRDDKYRIGFKLIKLGLIALSNLDLRNIAVPVLYNLSIRLQETSHLAVLSNYKSLIIEVCDSPTPLKISSRPGTTVSLHCSATGKVLLAFQIGEEGLASIFKRTKFEKQTKNTITSKKGIIAEVRKIIKTGFAFDDEEFHEGIRCLAAPVFNAYKETVGAVGITANTLRFKKDMVDAVAKEVMAAAKLISKNLGA